MGLCVQQLATNDALHQYKISRMLEKAKVRLWSMSKNEKQEKRKETSYTFMQNIDRLSSWGTWHTILLTPDREPMTHQIATVLWTLHMTTTVTTMTGQNSEYNNWPHQWQLLTITVDATTDLHSNHNDWLSPWTLQLTSSVSTMLTIMTANFSGHYNWTTQWPPQWLSTMTDFTANTTSHYCSDHYGWPHQWPVVPWPIFLPSSHGSSDVHLTFRRQAFLWKS